MASPAEPAESLRPGSTPVPARRHGKAARPGSRRCRPAGGGAGHGLRRVPAQEAALLDGHVSVARPPAGAEHANLLALEHVLSTANNIVDDPPTPFPEYAMDLAGRTRWSFRWD
ncbi:DUF4253 domain-containing protein [Streptomyces longwoodensis]|uniref:DUF4253 domain-containing protein n=1 Tax=Streptomyces longwoodensis TaxID=68231 RepID=UPI003826B443